MKILLAKVHEVPRQFAERLILAVLCAALCAQLLFSVRQLSQTADEATHLYAGYRYLRCGDLTVSPEHPPLAKMVAAAPLLSMNFAVGCAPFSGDEEKQALTALDWLYIQDWRSALFRARAAVSVFAVGLCILVWIAARRMFGLATAALATVLLVFEPKLLALGPLVMTDIPVSCMLLFAVLAFYLWIEKRADPFLLLTGLATGLTLLAKHSGVIVVPILFAMAVMDVLLQPTSSSLRLRLALRNLLAVALVCALSFGIVWAGYGMRFAAHPAGVQFGESRPGATSYKGRVLLVMKSHHVLPEAYLEGFVTALSISGHGGLGFVDAKGYRHAPWFSTPLTLVIRSTTASIAMLVLSVVGLVIGFRQRRREILFLLVPAGVFLVVCLYANSRVDPRYLWPTFPFLLIATAAGCVELARRVPWVCYAVPCLVVLHAASSLHAYPNYLSYANEFWGGPAKAYKYVFVDAGQALLEAKTYLERHPAADCWLITGWQWDPRMYGVPCRPFGYIFETAISPQVHGTVILSSSLLSDVRMGMGELAAPFRNLTPTHEIGGSALLVFEGDFDVSPLASIVERTLMRTAARNGDLAAALLHGKRAVELAPDSGMAHADFCAILAKVGQVESALNECYTAQSLLQHDPLREEQARAQILDSLEGELVLLRTQYRAIYGHDVVLVPPAAGADPR